MSQLLFWWRRQIQNDADSYYSASRALTRICAKPAGFGMAVAGRAVLQVEYDRALRLCRWLCLAMPV
jgi:hypothetical protein